MHITVIGAGYVGLVSAACFAEFGHRVTCVDVDAGRVERLRRAEIPIYEPGLDELVAQNVKKQTLSFETDIAAPLATSDAVFIAVGTPSRRGDGHADLSYVYNASRDIARHLKQYTVVVTKSTVPVGTGREIEKIIRETNPAAEFDVCSNPEFLREGSAINDFMRPDRVVVGCQSERAAAVMRAIYRPLYLIETPIVLTSLESAELIKYASNAFLATKITFINEIADLCEKVGADVQTVAKGMGLDGRIGRKFLHAGPGYGGSCFPKDTLALMQTARLNKVPMRLVEATIDVNNNRKKAMAQRVVVACGGSVQGKTMAILGVTFKPNTDDMRDSVSLDVIPALQQAGATIRAYDPVGMKEAAAYFQNVAWCDNAYEAMQGADAAVILTEWNEFRALDITQMKQCLQAPVLVDLRNIYRPDEMREAGFNYVSVGR
ncbi:MAG: UDP-glucose/GDP-mannose dehydrogenase family protein [Alphaproteobacteria bacterium]|nr:UDP-glucose/GDP-mannose dehydrogenase family protein [Alphaproteobacteria bacterium]MBV8547905.1 UDP-glucose/GDP-mannose dehydrogenase family protein [Alphaproteobacteria bacterium]